MMRSRGWRSSSSWNSARSSIACMMVPLPGVVRSMLIEGTTTTDSSSKSSLIDSHTDGIVTCKPSKTR